MSRLWRLSSQTLLAPGARIGPLTVAAFLDRSDRTERYRVTRDGHEDPLLLQVLTSTWAQDHERLARQARALGDLDHPNLQRVRGTVDVDGLPALLLDLPDGPMLPAWLAAAPQPLAARLAVARGVLAGLGAAHARGIVHRDLHDGAVWVEGEAHARLGGFELLRVAAEAQSVTSASAVLGRAPTAAPELARGGGVVDERADLFAFGCLLYQLATGRLAFPQRSVFEALEAKLARRYAPPDDLAAGLPRGVVAAIEACLHPEPARRPTAAAAVERLLS